MQEARRRFVVSTAAALGAVALGGCARSRPAPTPKASLTRILVLPVSQPQRFGTYNNIFLGGIATTIANNVKSNIFQETMEKERQSLGTKLTTQEKADLVAFMRCL